MVSLGFPTLLPSFVWRMLPVFLYLNHAVCCYEQKKLQTFKLLCSQNFIILEKETLCTVYFQHHLAEFKMVEEGEMVLCKQKWDAF